MSKEELKKYIFPIICVLVVIITFAMLFDMKKQINEKGNQVNSNSVVFENMVDMDSNTMVNEMQENTVTNEITTNNTVSTNTVNTTQNEVTSGDDDKYAENKQSQALELAKQNWGVDSTVYFTNESVNSSGEYIVAARDKGTTEVKQYFKVNIETGSVLVEY